MKLKKQVKHIYRQSCDFPDRVFLKHKSKMTGDCLVFKFFQRSVDGKHLRRVQIETSVFKFIRLSMEGYLFLEMEYRQLNCVYTSYSRRND